MQPDYQKVLSIVEFQLKTPLSNTIEGKELFLFATGSAVWQVRFNCENRVFLLLLHLCFPNNHAIYSYRPRKGNNEYIISKIQKKREPFLL